MSRSAKAEAALALHRFGMGPRPGSIAAIEADPRGALIAELDRPAISELAAANLPSSAKAYRAVTDAFAKRQAKAIVAKKEQDAKRQQMAEASAMMEGAAPGTGEMAAKMAAEAVPDPGRPIYLEEARIRVCGRARRRDRICRAAGLVLVQSFLRLGRQDPQHVRRL